jgi:hypothetical protein
MVAGSDISPHGFTASSAHCCPLNAHEGLVSTAKQSSATDLIPHSDAAGVSAAVLDGRRPVTDVICTIGVHDGAVLLGQSS